MNTTQFLTDEEIRQTTHEQILQQKTTLINNREKSIHVLCSMFPGLSDSVIADAFDFCKGDSSQVVRLSWPHESKFYNFLQISPRTTKNNVLL